MRSNRSLAACLVFGLGLACASAATARMHLDGPIDQNQVMHIGEVEVHGQQNITRTLQAIKIALTMPYSNDPKLANVMVCRLEDTADSHVKKELICGTNRTLALQRGLIQANVTAAIAQNSAPGTGSCMTSGCYSAVFAQLSETLSNLPGNYLHTTVNGSALRTALQNVPMPQPDAPAPVAAPAAASNPHTI